MDKCILCNGSVMPWYRKIYDDRHGFPGYFDIYRCTVCGFGRTKLNFSKKKIAHIYSNYYPRRNVDLNTTKEEDWILPSAFKIWIKGLGINSHYRAIAGEKVLNVGSGVGYELLELKHIGCQAYGIDPDKNSTKFARKFKLKFHCGFIDDNPFPGVSFDLIVGNQVIEHTENPVAFLIKCKKRMTKNGRIVMAFPNVDSLTRILLGKNWLHWHIPYHYNHFTKESVKVMVRLAGLRIENMRTITPNMWTNLGIRRLINKMPMGTRDEFWDGGQESYVNVKSNYFKLFLMRIFRSFYVILEDYNFFNRVIDALGLGESLVVELRALP